MTAPSATLRVVVLGCGVIAREHLRAISRYERACLIGLADPNEQALTDLADEFGVAERSTDAASMLEAVRPDVVHLATPPGTHLPLARLALAAGAHVYVEKPFTLNAREAEELVSLAEHKGLKLCVGYMHLFDKVMLQARRLIERGVVGSLVAIDSYYGFDRGADPRGRHFSQAYTDWAYQLPGGILQNGLDHPLSILLPFLREPKTVLAAAVPTGVLPRGVPDELRIVVANEQLVATVSLSEAASPRFHYVHLLGSKGTLQVDLLNKRVILFAHRPGIPHFLTRASMNANHGARVLAGTFGTAADVLRGRFDPYEGLERLVGAFYRAIEQGAPSPVPSEYPLTMMRIMDRVWEQIDPRPWKTEVAARRSATAELTSASPAPRGGRGRKLALVTGGTGFIGRRLVHALLSRGEAVRVLVRDLDKAEPLRRCGAEIVVGNLVDEESLRSAVSGAEVIYHLAATMGGSWSDYVQGTVVGTKKLVEAALAQESKRFIQASTIAVYGIPFLPAGQLVNEASPYAEENLTPYASAKIEAERIVLGQSRSSGLRATVLRLGIVYGSGKDALVSRIGWRVSDRLVVKVGLKDILLPSLWADNAVRAFLLAGNSDNESGSVYNVVDDVRFTQLQLLRAMSAYGGYPARYVMVPFTAAQALRAAVGKVGQGNALGRRLAGLISPFHLKSCATELTYDTSSIKRELGWSPDSDLEAHLRETFSWKSRSANLDITQPT